MNNGGDLHGMAAPPPIPGGSPSNGTAMMHRRHHMLMHMTFFWGKNTEILFDGWPGYDHLGLYILALAVVFVLSVAVEFLSHCSILRGKSPSTAAGLLQTLLYTVRMGLAYLVMLAVMSFNAGVFLVAIAGHGIGFFFFGSRAFKRTEKAPDLPPMSC